MKADQIKALADVTAKAIKEYVYPLIKRIEALEAREYQGVYIEGREYTRGQTATFKGSIWHCNRKTTQRPGECGDWTLAVKAGRDGKDAR